MASPDPSRPDPTDAGEGQTWMVEEIAGWKTVQVHNLPGTDDYDPTLPAHKWQLRYVVKWENYDLNENESEPRSSFDEWVYDEQIQALLDSNPALRDPREHEADVERWNAELRKAEEKKKKKKKSQEKRLKTREANKKASGQASRQSPSVSVHLRSATPKGRLTQNSAQQLFDVADYVKDLQDGSDAKTHALFQLIADPPRRDDRGNLVSSSDDSDGDVKPKFEVNDDGFADDSVGEVPKERDEQRTGRRDEPREEEDGFADASDEESAQQQQPITRDADLGDGPPSDDGFADDTPQQQLHAGGGPRSGGVGARASGAAAAAPSLAFDDMEDFADDLSEGFVDDGDTSPEPQVGKRPRSPSPGDWAEEEEDVAPPPAKVRQAVPQPPPARPAPAPPRRTNSAASNKQLPSSRRPPAARRTSGRSDSGSFTDVDGDEEPLLLRPRKSAPAATAQKLAATMVFKINNVKITRLSNSSSKASSQSTSRPADLIAPKQEPAPKKKSTASAARRPAPRIASASSDDSEQEAQTSKRTTTLSILTGSTGRRAAPEVDPFNHGVTKATAANGFVRLNRPILQNQLGVYDTFKRHPRLAHLDKTADLQTKICALYDIPNILENFFDFEATMKDGPAGPRECYIFAPAKEDKLSAKGRDTLRDYTTLQYLLSGIKGVKQSDALRSSVKAVFVHVSERDEIGAYPTGKLAELEHFRASAANDTVFVLFGERKKVKDFWGGGGVEKEFVFKSFWSINATFTVTPNLFVQRPAQVSKLLDRAVASRKHPLGRRDLQPWAPALFYADRGPFASPRPKDVDGQTKLRDSPRYQGFIAFHHAVSQQTLSLLEPFPTAPIQEDVYFPVPVDAHQHGNTGRNELHLWLSLLESDESRQKALEANVEKLQLLSRMFRSTYLQLRRWIVVGTEEEVRMAAAVPGVEVVTLEQAVKLFA